MRKDKNPPWVALVKATAFKVYPVEVLVELIEGLGRAAVNVVPPVADEDGLVEDGATGAEEAVLASVEVAVVVHLQRMD